MREERVFKRPTKNGSVDNDGIECDGCGGVEIVDVEEL
jgi:hypothetical protein